MTAERLSNDHQSSQLTCSELDSRNRAIIAFTIY